MSDDDSVPLVSPTGKSMLDAMGSPLVRTQSAAELCVRTTLESRISGVTSQGAKFSLILGGTTAPVCRNHEIVLVREREVLSRLHDVFRLCHLRHT